MSEKLTCPKCGNTFTCDPQGDCWCKAYPAVEIPEALKGKGCLCPCVLDDLVKEQHENAAHSENAPSEVTD